jgi:hypothetical protein
MSDRVFWVQLDGASEALLRRIEIAAPGIDAAEIIVCLFIVRIHDKRVTQPPQ